MGRGGWVGGGEIVGKGRVFSYWVFYTKVSELHFKNIVGYTLKISSQIY